MKTKDLALKAAERIARLKVEESFYSWTPMCFGFLHQPKRPEKGKHLANNTRLN